MALGDRTRALKEVSCRRCPKSQLMLLRKKNSTFTEIPGEKWGRQRRNAIGNGEHNHHVCVRSVETNLSGPYDYVRDVLLARVTLVSVRQSTYLTTYLLRLTTIGPNNKAGMGQRSFTVVTLPGSECQAERVQRGSSGVTTDSRPKRIY